MSLNIKALPWYPCGSDEWVWSFMASATLCTHCVVSLHQQSAAVEEDGNGGFVGIVQDTGWYITASAVAGTETEQETCTMCGGSLSEHTVPDCERHGHAVRFMKLCSPISLHGDKIVRAPNSYHLGD